jgi:hypothetical protein
VSDLSDFSGKVGMLITVWLQVRVLPAGQRRSPPIIADWGADDHERVLALSALESSRSWWPSSPPRTTRPDYVD